LQFKVLYIIMNISKTKEQINLRKQSFGYAFEGFKVLWSSEANFRIHLLISILVLGLSYVLKINTIEWMLILFCIGIVCSAEAFNTAIEHLCNLNSKEIKSEIKIIKDISAFAVLFLAIISIIIGFMIFLPKVISLFTSI